jgi:uncharacterized phiE125 gp8 family phage protein
MKHKDNCDFVHSLVSLAEAKEFLCVDDRDDSLLGFLLVSGSYAIEEYCMRRLLRKRIKERFEASCYLTLREYPVAEVSAVELVDVYGASSPFFYDLSPEAGTLANAPHILRPLLPDYVLSGRAVRVKYIAGWRVPDVPPDLKEACLELTAWKYQRHNMRLSGVAGKGAAAFENRMPERVRELLEPYRRRVL